MLERHVLLCTLVEMMGRVRGRTRFQKMLYISKALGYSIPENFGWGNYGVYSADLQSELDMLSKEEFLREEDVGSDRPEYEYSLADKGRGLLEKSRRLASEDDDESFPEAEFEGIFRSFGNREIDELGGLLHELNRAEVSDLELWSSILFLGQSERDRGGLVSFLHYLKPNFSPSMIEKAIDVVEKLGQWKRNRDQS